MTRKEFTEILSQFNPEAKITIRYMADECFLGNLENNAVFECDDDTIVLAADLCDYK